MAAPDFNPSQKPLVYDLISQLNAALARVNAKMSALERIGIFDSQTMLRLSRLSEEFRADANFHFLQTLQGIEQSHWAEYGRKEIK